MSLSYWKPFKTNTDRVRMCMCVFAWSKIHTLIGWPQRIRNLNLYETCTEPFKWRRIWDCFIALLLVVTYMRMCICDRPWSASQANQFFFHMPLLKHINRALCDRLLESSFIFHPFLFFHSSSFFFDFALTVFYLPSQKFGQKR